MKQNNFLSRLFVLACVVALAACTKDDERVSVTDTADVVAESLTDAYFDDMDDMAFTATASEDSPSSDGRIARDDRFCFAVTVEQGSNSESGKLMVDFGTTGCTDARGNVRKGKLTFDYSNGPFTNIGFTVVTTPENYSINGVKLDGTRTLKYTMNSTPPFTVIHQITVENGKATWEDGAISTRESDFHRYIVFDANMNITQVMLHGSASGTNRRGKAYDMNIEEMLVYKRECVVSDGIYMPVEGVKTFGSEGRQLTIDYGNGGCDRSVVVSVGGMSGSITLDPK